MAEVLAFAATALPTAQCFAAQPVHPPACLSKTPAQQHDTEGAHTIQEYQDPDPGLNGIVRLSHDRGGRLVAMSLSVAL